MRAVTYSSYGRREGFAPLPDKKVEFENISEKLFDVNARIRYLAFCEQDGSFEAALVEKEAVLAELAAVSKPRRKTKFA